jgi:hypothetical protein
MGSAVGIYAIPLIIKYEIYLKGQGNSYQKKQISFFMKLDFYQ